MVLRSGPNARLPAGFLAPLLRCNPTAPCAARPPSRSMRKSADPNTMALCACCMLVVLAFAAVAHFGSSVKSILPPQSHDGSAPCFGLCLLILLPLPLCPSSLLPPPLPPSAPLLWRDWPRRSLRRPWLQLIRRETVTFSWEPFPPPRLPELPVEQGEIVSSREQRAHYRLSWSQRLDRNARPADAPRLSVLLHG